MIALVISIIVMLILAGVSINAIVGEDGVLTKAIQASTQQKIAADLETLNMELTGLNTDLIVGGKENYTTDEITEYLTQHNVLDDAKRSESGNILGGIDMETGERFFLATKDENTYKIIIGRDGMLSASISTTSSGGEVEGGTVIVSSKDFNDDATNEEDKGKFKITSDSEVLFMDTISGDLSIYIQAGVKAKVGIYADMTLTNQNLTRSAIDIENGGELTLYVAENTTLTVNSGFATEAIRGQGKAGTPGYGGYAGIHVPEEAVINLSGKGTIYAYGGNASKGKDSISGDYGGSGGGGAGAGIGGNGGNGGWGATTVANDWTVKQSDGYKGENCGTVNICNSVTVYAYGGAGGSGGIYEQNYDMSGTGAGGYPAAGIGGGGVGGGAGNHINGGGGYSSGLSEDMRGRGFDAPANGTTGGYIPTGYYANGGSYLENGHKSPSFISQYGGHIGGQCPGDYQTVNSVITCCVGSGGIAGKGRDCKGIS